MGTVASELKSEREKRKVSLADIAAETRISLRYLESLEEGRLSDLPGGIYNRAFLRAYCETLNLDNLDEIMRRYEDEVTPTSDKTAKPKIYLPPKTHTFRISPLVVWGIMLLASITGLFFSRNWITAVFSPYFSHTPPAAVPYEPIQPKPAPSAAIVTPAPAPPAQPESAPSETTQTVQTDQTSPLPIQSTATAAVQPAISETKPPVTQLQSSPIAPPAQLLRLEINATATCWVSVDKDGSPLFRKTMQAGEVQQIAAGEKFLIILGNAGGVNLKINGKPAKPLGKPGEVVKFTIDSGKLQDLLMQAAG